MSKFLILIIFLILTAGIGFYYLVFTGVIKVESSIPPVATVQIDDVVVGDTPIKQRIRAGVHEITVYKEGFETWQGEAKVSGLAAAAVSAKLRFLLRSEPAGAKVIMDGKYLGVTNMATELKPGYHIFEFKKDGYQRAKFKAVIPELPGEPLPIAKLALAEAAPPAEEIWSAEEPMQPGFGAIQVTSTPDAQVYLDGELQGETPLTIKQVPAGSYVISLSKEGYREARQTVYVKKDETTKVAGELKPVEQ